MRLLAVNTDIENIPASSVTVEISYQELWALKGLCQNTAPEHFDNPQLMGLAEKMFTFFNQSKDYIDNMVKE